jgi:hypothetical protein
VNNPTLAPLIDSNVFGWLRSQQQYYLADSLQPGYGYWLYSYTNCSLAVIGFSYPSLINFTTSLSTSWNTIGLIGNTTMDKTLLSIQFNTTMYNWTQATTINNPTNAPIIDPNIFEWVRAGGYYNLAQALVPGHSYWVYGYQNCQLHQQY